METHLRYYQQNCHDAVIQYIKKSYEPALCELPTGAGKSHIIAAIAHTIHSRSGKNVLCIQPNADLVRQNRAKYLESTGQPASVFSASAGSKCLKHPVVFGTPRTIKNSLARFGGKFAMVIIDECAGITPTIKAIIAALKEYNPKLRVIGFDAAPYRMKTGYIYRMFRGVANTDENCLDPYFAEKIYSVSAKELISKGFLTAPKVEDISVEQYDTPKDQTDKEIDRAYHGHGRLTADIVADIVRHSGNKKGVLIFAATIQHAKEIKASLPPKLSVIVTSETRNRKRISEEIKAQKYKYIVNVGVYTKGFDAPHIDSICLLRLTASAQLLQQIIGRGTRIYPGKHYFSIRDYAGNLERHFPDGDVFSPDIKVGFSAPGGSISLQCPQCGTEQEHTARPNVDGFDVDEFGYFLDLEGLRVEIDKVGPMPAHYGRRCTALLPGRNKTFHQCTYRWTFKSCPACDHENDIAAKYCQACKHELIDPNEKLQREFKAFKRDPQQIQCDRVLSRSERDYTSKKGRECLVVNFTTEYRTFQVYYVLGSHQHKLYITLGREADTVTYQKDAASGYYKTIAFGQDEDILRNE